MSTLICIKSNICRAYTLLLKKRKKRKTYTEVRQQDFKTITVGD